MFDKTIFYDNGYLRRGMFEEDDDEINLSLDGWSDYEDVPLLLIDLDPARAAGRYEEMAKFCGFIQPATQDVVVRAFESENRHALRLLLIYEDLDALAKHLKRCLDDPVYGYGERGDNGRTIAQAMTAVGDLDKIAAAWLAAHRNFQRAVLAGRPVHFGQLFGHIDSGCFIPILQRVGEETWRLGVEGKGKHRDFQGPVQQVWPDIEKKTMKWGAAVE